MAMLVDRNNKNCLHKNKVLFPKDENFIVLTTNIGTAKTIDRIKLIVISKFIYIYVCMYRDRERERAIRTGTFVTKKGHFGNMGNFCNIDGELL